MSLVEPPQTGFRLSPQQRRLWRAGGDAAPFRVECAARCLGPLDEARLAAAFARVEARHEILRTRLRSRRGMNLPLQMVEETPPPADDPGSPAVAAVEMEVERAGDAPRVRLSAPALLLDPGSLRRLLLEVGEAYAGGEAGDRREAPVQYADASAWLNELQEDAEAEAERAVWRRHLHRAEPAPLPFAAPPSEEPFTPRFASRGLAPDTVGRLLDLAGSELPGLEPEAALEALLAAAWGVLLGRLGAGDPPVVAHAFDGRSYQELDDSLGLFEQYLPVVVRAAPGEAFGRVAVRHGNHLAELYDVQEVFPEDADRGPWPHAFCYRPRAAEVPAGDLTLVPEVEHAVTAPFSVRLCARRRADGLDLELGWDAAAVGEADAVGLLEGFATLLAAAARAPGTPVGALPLISPQARHHLLFELNAAVDGAGDMVPVHRQVGERARRTPERPAVGWGEQWITYGELEARAGALAARLRRHGAAVDRPVALCMERSPEVVVALLAVLKSGAAYLPLDPEWPPARLAATLEAADPVLVLTDAASTGRLPVATPQLRLGGARDGAEGADVADEAPPVPAGALAYVIFTSGSTGTPKGVAVEHAHLARYVAAARRRLGFADGARFLLVSTFAADLGHTALFPALCAGGSLAVAPWQETLKASALAAAQPYDGLKIVPSHLAALLAQDGGGAVLPRRWLVLGGEACPPELVRRVGELAPETAVFNHYGPTETTVGALAGRVDGAGPRAEVPLGRPLAGVRAYVLDRGLEPLPRAVPGELFLGGGGVARGYLGRPAATAARFLPDPFAVQAGGRMYRTGDRVRQGADGAFTFLGRTDHQVKVRGFRVELGEVESHLLRLDGVEAAVVTPFTDPAGDTRLAAYLVPDATRPPEVAELRRRMAEALPEPMLPAVYVRLDALPLTANGKVDRAALPEPREEPDAAPFAAPSGAVEEGLAAIWSELLGRDRVGSGDDFFALGGHSLLVTQLLARVEDMFAVTLPLDVPFERPRLGELAAAVEEAMRRSSGVAVPPIEPRAEGEEDVLSLAQQRLWFLHQLDPDSPVFNVPSAVRVDGRLDVGCLAAAVSAVSRRHDVLRSRYPEERGEARLVVDPPRPVPLPVVDLGRLAGDRRRRQQARLVRAEGGRPMDLARGPVLRLVLLRLEEESHVLLQTLHHVVCDAWSRTLWVREVTAFYAAALGGGGAPLPELPVQYPDFAAWQRRWLRGETLLRLLDHWRGRLTGLPVLDLPTDRPRPATQSYRGGRVRFDLPADLTAGVDALSRAGDTTPFVTLAAAFQALLARYSGQSDFAVGIPAMHRGRRETEDLIGLFLNLLVLRADVGGGASFRHLQGGVRREVLAALVHQDMPFEKLVDELEPERSMGRSPLFQVYFTLQNVPRDPVSLPGVSLQPLPVPLDVAKYDLSLYLEPRGDRLGGLLEYASDLFDEVTVVRMVRHFRQLLTAAVERPEAPLADLPLLTPPERHQLLREWGGETQEAPGTVHRLVAARAARSPGAVAARFAGRDLGYGDLQRRVAELAGHLASLGVGRGDRVAVYVDRGPALLVATLGVLRAGAAYVPMDPLYPPSRLAYMLRDSGAVAAVTEAGLAADLELAEERLVLLGPDGAVPSAPAAPAPPVEMAPADLAYVIYTSGSTGRPKGVAVSHGSLLAFLVTMRSTLGAAVARRMLALTTLSFDIAALELFLPLVCGGTVVIASRDEARDVAALPPLLEAEEVSSMQATPATWRLLVESGWEGRPGLVALCGGEALAADLAAALVSRVDTLWNVYGPTEATVWATAERVRGTGAGGPSIGRPLGHARAHVLDPGMRPTPAGVPGQLWLAGPALARGYHRRPALTAEHFRPDGLAVGAPGGRLYATGDLARHRGDGRLEFLGRVDQQVKLRGYRVELEEVEARLRRHPAVRAAAVALRDDGTGPRLAAYFVADDPVDGDGVPSTPELRDHLARWLPGYMVPSVFHRLTELPRTPNGKIDRKALPDPEPVAGEAAGGTLPATSFQRRLAELWRQLLRVDRVYLESSFFDLGGHSLLATRLLFRVRKELGVEAPLRLLFDAPTLGAMARALEGLEPGAEGGGLSSLPPIVPRPGERHEPFPLNHVQHAYWIGRQGAFELGNVASHSYRELSLPGLEVGRLATAVDRLVERHDMLRAVVLPDGGQRILERVPACRIPVTDLRGLPPEAAERAFAAVRGEMSHQMISTDRWPLFDLRVTLRDDDLLLHVSFDYLIADGWSIPVLMRDVARFYEDPGATLPALELSFRDCVLADRDLQDTPLYETARDYWLQRVDSLPAAPDLPRVRELGELDNPRFVRRSGSLEPADWGRLKERAAGLGLTPSGLLLAAFAEALAMWAKSPRFCLNVTLFNRLPRHPQIFDLVGDFTSLNLLEVDLSRRRPFAAEARSVMERLWQDLEHRLFSGVEVVRELVRRRGRGSEALMPVVFTSFLVEGRPRTEQPAAAGEGPRGGLVYNITQTPQVWLDHQVIERGGALRYNWDAVDELFPPRLLDDLFAAYRALLDRLASDDEAWHQPVSGLLPARQEEARRRVNATAGPSPDHRLHEPFVEQAAGHPERAAVLSPDRELTYGELRAAAESVATALRERGADPERPVAVVMEKGWEQVAAVLGVAESGAPYLPVDAALPAARRNHLLARGGVRLALVQPSLADRLDWPPGVVPLALGEGGVEAPAEPPAGDGPGADGRPRPATPDDLAYVLFTSGSTGEPKGVAVDHRAAANTVADVNRRFAIGPGDRVLGLSSLSFDLSVWDVFGLLAAGGGVVLPESAAARDPARWLELVRRHGVTVWNSVPALMEMFVEHLEAAGGGAPSLRLVLLSGDWIPLSLADRIRRLAPEAEVVSLGGATEAAIWSILHPVDEVREEWSSVPYGRPMVNQRFRVLDERLRDRPDWVPGQLHIAGAGLARGYWRDEEITAASFVHHPEDGERLYRTGDLGRYWPDGTLEFLGREDSQVKIRGHRIELGEVEAVLERCPELRAAAVAAPGGRHDRRLVAYGVPAADAGGDGEELARRVRAFLAERLPAYMVPADFVPLDALPLTANGKVDRKALPRPGRSRGPSGGGRPESDLERRVAAIWQQVLGVEEVGLRDNFFDLGGDSVRMVQVHNRLQAELGRELPIVDLFRNPTLETLTASLEPATPEGEDVGGDGDDVRRRAEQRRAARRRRRGRRGGGGSGDAGSPDSATPDSPTPDAGTEGGE